MMIRMPMHHELLVSGIKVSLEIDPPPPFPRLLTFILSNKVLHGFRNPSQS